MKTKIVLWGTNDKDERVLIALQLRAQDNKVDLFTFPESLVTEDFYNEMMDNWRNDKEVAFPDGHHKEARNLSATESLLPEHLKVERGDLVQRAQTEWHFVVLSSKLNEIYQSELADMKERFEKMKSFQSSSWDELKDFWDKVQTQIQERNLFREHANTLRETTNNLFDHLKKMRTSMDEEFKTESKVVYDKFMGTLAEVEEKVSKGLNLQSVFNELRNLQKDFKDVKLTKEHRAKVWNKLDRLFKVVKDKRYGGTTAEGGGETAASDSPMARLKSRYDGLMDALNRMESSIKRDKSDLDFQNQKIAESEGQLEAQIRTAKIKMVVERIDSKMEKLDDMLKTKAELESKMAAQAERDKKNAERAKEQEVKEAAKEAAKEKIAAKIAENQESHAAEADELAKAAAAITGAKKESPKTEAPKEKATTETLMSAVGITLSEAFEDVVDTVKAVAEVVSEKMEEKLEEMKKAVADEDDSPEDTEEK
jgi:hypothetical protein